MIVKRTLTSHKVNGLNEALTVNVLDDPGPGGACCEYDVSFSDGKGGTQGVMIEFQNGNPAEGVNGISNEALLAIVEDRLKGFSAGRFATRENAIALTHVQTAMFFLHHRTRERAARGAEIARLRADVERLEREVAERADEADSDHRGILRLGGEIDCLKADNKILRADVERLRGLMIELNNEWRLSDVSDYRTGRTGLSATQAQRED